jgi:hypothetical protein
LQIGTVLKSCLWAMFGLRMDLPHHRPLVWSLISNGSTEAIAMGAWTLAFGLAGAVLVLAGQFIHMWPEPDKTIALAVAATPISISVVGLNIHMCRAYFALSAARRLAVKKLPGGPYDRVICNLTATTPWVLVPQTLLGVAFAIFVSTHRVQ